MVVIFIVVDERNSKPHYLVIARLQAAGHEANSSLYMQRSKNYMATKQRL
jgi:hypothetical protein